MMSETEYWLWFTMAFGPANPRKWNVFSRFGSSVERCCREIMSGNLSAVASKDIRSVSSVDINGVRRLIELCDEKGISVCTYDSEQYPQRLREIYNPPSVLFYRGDISEIDSSLVIAAVGTREPERYSVEMSERIIKELVGEGIQIASGFALGLDSVAISTALKAKGKVYAVLPCGILYDYPPENARAKDVVVKNGALISEYFPMDKPSTLMFRARNRILSGMCLGTFVMQAGTHSGALSTASFALSQGRDIFCIPPHNLYDERYAGASRLIRDGAVPVFDGSDIIGAYKKPSAQMLSDVREYVSGGSSDEKSASKRGGTHRKKENYPEPEITDSPALRDIANALTGSKRGIYEMILSRGSVHLEELEREVSDSIELEAMLTELELDGFIQSLPGNRFGTVQK